MPHLRDEDAKADPLDDAQVFADEVLHLHSQKSDSSHAVQMHLDKPSEAQSAV